MSVASINIDIAKAGFRVKTALLGLLTSLTIILLSIVDIRRGFLFGLLDGFGEYISESPYYVFSILHLVLLLLGGIGTAYYFRQLSKYEKDTQAEALEKYVKFAALTIFAILVVDLFAYRSVPAYRIISSGEIGAGWLDAWGVTGWLQPFALAASYMITVWHATFLGLLLAALSLTILPKYFASFYTRTGLGGSLFGATYALPQPFCSCCASVVTPSLQKQGASSNFMLAFVVGSPMLNISGLVLAAVLLPTPYAITRILGGIILTVPVTYGISKAAERWDIVNSAGPNNWFTRITARLAGMYCELFHLDEIIEGRRVDTPTQFLRAYAQAAKGLAYLLVPTLFIWSVVSAALFQVLPMGYGNNLISIVISAVVGTFLMISTWTEIPVAMQMINAGLFAPAATMLLVLPPVSLPCLMILGGAIGKFRVIGLLSLAVISIGIFVGVLFI